MCLASTTGLFCVTTLVTLLTALSKCGSYHFNGNRIVYLNYTLSFIIIWNMPICIWKLWGGRFTGEQQLLQQMKNIFFFYLPWNSKCGYSIWSSTQSLLLTQLPAGMTESQWDILTFLKVSSDATQNRTKHPCWMSFMLIPESIHFQDHYLAFMCCQKIVFQQLSHSVCCTSFGAFYVINHFNLHCLSRSPCVITRNVGNHFFTSSQT